MITIAMATVIGATRTRVWRALTVPAEVIRWDERIFALAEPIDGYPQAGQRARWRCRLGSVAMDLHDRPLEVVPPERLRSSIKLGLFEFEETYQLTSDTTGARTRLALRLVSSNAVPVVGGVLDRFAVRSLASRIVNGNLHAIQRWCETHPEAIGDRGAAPHAPPPGTPS